MTELKVKLMRLDFRLLAAYSVASENTSSYKCKDFLLAKLKLIIYIAFKDIIWYILQNN